MHVHSPDHKTTAAANVPCPQSGTSVLGENQRSLKWLCVSKPPAVADTGSTNAVTFWLSSTAIRCRCASSNGDDSKHTAAGLPLKASDVNASTCMHPWTMRWPVASSSSTVQSQSGNSTHSSHSVSGNPDIAHCQTLSGLALPVLSLLTAAAVEAA